MILIGSNIQQHRKKQELSQEEFAVRVGVTRQAVSKWETDKAYPDLDKLVTICEILHVSITELVYGEAPATSVEPAGQDLKAKGIAAEKARGKGACLRLLCMLAVIGGAFLFCGALLAAALTHHAWKKEDSLAERARVERVYQQYTKADVSFFDDVSRRVTKTVWLDVNGIREGDFLVCYTDGEQRNVYHAYRGTTLIVLTAVELILFLLIVMCLVEYRRLIRENGWRILTDETKENAGKVSADKTKGNAGKVSADKTKGNAGKVSADKTKGSAEEVSADETKGNAGEASVGETKETEGS